MKKLIFLVLLLPSLVLAQSNTVARRNDTATTTLQSSNLRESALAVTSKGELFVTSLGIPITPSGTQDTNLKQINGNTTAAGNGVSGTGVQRVTIASDSTGQVTLASGANTIGSLTANQSVNTAQINGVAPTMGNGISGTGVQRVTLASDGTGVVGLSTGSNVIGSLTANQSVNTAQINGVAPSMGNGISGTGVQRVTLASDGTGVVGLSSGAAIIGSLAANQSVNVAQINGVAPLMGSGSTGTGSHRVTIATDQPAFTTAVPANQTQINGVAVSAGNGISGTGVQRVTLASDGTGVVGLAAGAATIGSLAANQSVNVAQINGVAPLMGAGNTGTGSHRVTIATDQAAFTTAVPANQTQINGVAVSAGNGISGTGVQRVTLASDGTGVVGLAAGAATIGSLAANQSVNVAQINGVTPLMGSGITGTGSHRVTIATDQPSLTNPVPANQTQINGVTVATGTGTSSTGVQRIALITDQPNLTTPLNVQGAAASGATVSGNPVLQGTEGRSTINSAVTNGQATRQVSTLSGLTLIQPFGPPADFFRSNSGFNTTTTEQTLNAAPGANLAYLVQEITISSKEAAVRTVAIGFNTGATTTFKNISVPLGGTVVMTFPGGLVGLTNGSFVFTFDAGTVVGMSVTASGYIIKVA